MPADDDSERRADRLSVAEREGLSDALRGRYELLRELGAGGTATVLLARAEDSGQFVALKVLHGYLSESVTGDRFLREIRILQRLSHPHILSLIDSGQAGGRLFYTMAWVEGESLRDLLDREAQLPVSRAVDVARQVAGALAYAHAQGIVHRDIKPGNIILAGAHAYVVDFGIARALSASVADVETLTSHGYALGTPAYMSPEQATADSHLDERTDVYSLGVVLYEMLTGEPPFGGPTPHAVIARRLVEAPPPLGLRRPSVKPALEVAVHRALERLPADRFSSAGEMADALAVAERDDPHQTGPRPTSGADSTAARRRRHAQVAVVMGASAAALLAATAVYARRSGSPLDRNRVVVFPMRNAAPGPATSGIDGIPTLLGYALERAPPLRWIEGEDEIDRRRIAPGAPLDDAEKRRISRALGAAHYIDGTVFGVGDSLALVLRLLSVSGDSLVRREGAAAPRGDAVLSTLALRAVGRLLPALVEPGRRIDLSALSDRNPAAIARFLQGDREYRQFRFAPALTLYREAIAIDSQVALAAVKGAQAASWLRVMDATAEAQALALIELAVRGDSLLPERYARYARGVSHSLHGRADAAAGELQRVVAMDSTWAEARMALGEVYFHLIPDTVGHDSLAEREYRAARSLDSSFTPPLYQLTQYALRRGHADSARAYLRFLGRLEADSTFAPAAELMAACAERGPQAVDWKDAASRSSMGLVRIAKAVAAGGSQPLCARAAWLAILRDDSSGVEARWGAVLGLNGVLAAAGRVGDLKELSRSPLGRDTPAEVLLLLDAAGALDVRGEAERIAAERGLEYGEMGSAQLWLLSVWATERGDTSALRRMDRVMHARTVPTRVDSLIRTIIGARLLLAEGDSARAVAALRALRPTGTSGAVEWDPWESLGAERLLLARVSLIRGDAAGALRAATFLDHPWPVTNLIYLRESLRIRVRASEALGDTAGARTARDRLARLDTDTTGVRWK